MSINNKFFCIFLILLFTIIIYSPRHFDIILNDYGSARFLLRDLFTLFLLCTVVFLNSKYYKKIIESYVKLSVILGIMNFVWYFSTGDFNIALNPRDWHYLLPSKDLSLILLVISSAYLYKLSNKLSLDMVVIFVMAFFGTRTALIVLVLFIFLFFTSKLRKPQDILKLIVLFVFFVSFFVTFSDILKEFSPKTYELYDAIFIKNSIYEVASVQDLVTNHIQNIFENNPITLFGNPNMIMQGAFESGLISDSGFVIVLLTKGYFGLVVYSAMYLLILSIPKEITFFSIFIATTILFVSIKGYYYDSPFLIVLTLLIFLSERQRNRLNYCSRTP